MMAYSIDAAPDYRAMEPMVRARFERIRQRPVILTVRDLKKTYEGEDGTRAVFENVSLDIHRREFVTVIGPSGPTKHQTSGSRGVAWIRQACAARSPGTEGEPCRSR